MTNVETVELTNTTTVGRTFTASEVTGVTQYNLVGEVNLASLDSIVTVDASARKTDLTIAYASKVTDGTADVLALSVADFGVADDAATTTTNEEDAVKITVAGVEQTDITVKGTNVLDLTGLDSKDITIVGAGSTKITDVNTATKTIDASSATADMDVNVATGTSMTKIATGSGDDKITLIAASDVTANAVISGGEGADNLVFTGASNTTLQLDQSGIETLTFDIDNTGVLNLSLKNTTGVEKLVATKDFKQDATLSTVGTGDMTVSVQGANASGKTLSSDHSGTTIINVETPAKTATLTSPNSNDIDVKVAKTTNVTLNVAEKMAYAGTVTAGEATSITVSLNGAAAANSKISAAKATGVAITNVDAASDLDLDTAKAVNLQIENAKDLNLTGSTLKALETLTSAGAGALDLTGVALGNLNNANISNTGKVVLNNTGTAAQSYATTVNATGSKGFEIGTMTTDNQNITLSATGIIGDVKADAIDAKAGNVSVTAGATGNLNLVAITGKNVTIDAQEVLGTATYGGPITAQNLTFKGAELANNDLATGTKVVTLTGATNTIDLTGGIANDTFVFNNATTTTTVTVKGDLNIGTTTDSIAFNFANAVQAQAYTLDITGLADYDKSTITLSAAQDATIKLGSGTDVDTIKWSGDKKATITGFEFGAGKDKLDLDAFLTATAAFYEAGGAGTTITGDGVAATSTTPILLANIDKKVVLVTTTDISTQVVDEATLFGAAKAFAAEGTPTEAISSVLLVGETSGTDGVKVYHVTDGNDADDMTVTLVGTLNGVSLADVHADNLA